MGGGAVCDSCRGLVWSSLVEGARFDGADLDDFSVGSEQRALGECRASSPGNGRGQREISGGFAAENGHRDFIIDWIGDHPSRFRSLMCQCSKFTGPTGRDSACGHDASYLRG